jgi:hypothetical protein
VIFCDENPWWDPRDPRDQELKFKTELTIHIRKRWDGGTLEIYRL